MRCQIITTTTPLPLSPEICNRITVKWQQFTIWRPTNEIATLCRFISKTNGILQVATDVTYRDVVGLRWRQQIEPATTLFQVVTAIGIVRTADQHLVLIPRNSGDWEEALECPGGFIRAAHLQNGLVSVDDFIRQRVIDDLHLSTTDITSCRHYTTYNAKEILEHMLVYHFTLTQTAAQLATSHPTFVIVPPPYTPDNHHHYTKLPLHPPTKGALLLV